MTVHTRTAAACSLLVAALLATACGQSSFSPTSPSPASGSGLPGATAGALITGTVSGAAQTAAAGTFTTLATTPVTVTVVGTTLSTTIDGSGRFSLEGVPTGDVQLKFAGTGIDATLTVPNVTSGDRIDVRVAITANGVRLEAMRRERRDDRVEFDGRIAAVDATARTIRVGERTVEIPASAILRRGGDPLTFDALRVGDRVEIHATVDGARVIATEVNVENGDDDDGDDDDEDDDNDRGDGSIELEGLTSALSGACPDITFTLRSVTVRANAATQYEDGSCAAVQNNLDVEVRGTRQSDGSLLALQIELED